jgi:hypothetical protein
MDYGEEKWKEKEVKVMNKMKKYNDEVKKKLIATLDWLHEYGIGKKINWDEKWIIE